MKIKSLYEKYEIMPQLATHQLRVGAIARLITKDWSEQALGRETVIACLLHDMGNLVKFENLAEPYWRTVQAKYRAQYGKDAHTATTGILREAGLDLYADYIEEEKQLYEKTPTATSEFAAASKPAVMILYADIRVSPQGIVTIQERNDDLEFRYKNKRTESVYGPPLEQYVQTLTNIKLDEITEAAVEPLFDELLTLNI